MASTRNSGITTKPRSGNALRRLTFKQRLRKFLVIMMAILVLSTGTYIYWQFYYTFSEGYYQGTLQNFANRGNAFKTFEGELLINRDVDIKKLSSTTQSFFFSVTNYQIAQILDTVQGKTIMVHYQQKNSTLFWRGDSEYLVDSVIIVH